MVQHSQNSTNNNIIISIQISVWGMLAQKMRWLLLVLVKKLFDMLFKSKLLFSQTRNTLSRFAMSEQQ